MKTVLSHANLIDCVEPKIRPDSAVLIEDGRIHAILPSGEAGSASDARVIDLKGGYLMPGLWDVHIHPDYLSLDEMPLADQVTLFGHRLARIRHCRTALRRRPSLHGRRMEAGLRLRTACRSSAVRQRLFPHHHGRTLPDLGSCAGGGRPLWLGESRPRADQERRRPHQA